MSAPHHNTSQSNGTFLKLGGNTVSRWINRHPVPKILELGIQPIMRIPCMGETEKLPHYVVVKGVSKDCSFEVVDP